MNTNKLLMEMGISPDVVGYHYLADAINARKEMVANGNVAYKFTDLYADVGKKFNCKATNVERTMRHAVEGAFKHGNDALCKIFRPMIKNQSGKVTVACFIGTLAEYLIMEEN